MKSNQAVCTLTKAARLHQGPVGRTKRLLGCLLGCGLGFWSLPLWAQVDAGQATPTAAYQINPNELLDAEPVESSTAVSSGSQQPSDNLPDLLPTAETTPPPDEYQPPAGPSSLDYALPESTYPMARPLSRELTSTTLSAQPMPPPLSPYFLSAYVPDPDHTEVLLGLLLSSSPGIDMALAWSAWYQFMLSAKMTVQGASHSAGLNFRYGLRQELAIESKPALAAIFGWNYVNHRQANESRENIFRGNRLRGGIALSKSLGSLARSLSASSSVESFLNYFYLHTEALLEFQTGRQGKLEDELSRWEFGARVEIEILLDPERLRLMFVTDTLSNWLDKENHYLGVRYYASPDFALDTLAGWLGENISLLLALAWIF